MDALRSSYFVIIPQTLRNDDSLSLNAKLLYGDIVALANDKGYCFASNAALADRLRLTERSISRLLAALEERGYIHAVTVYDHRHGACIGRQIYPRVDAPIPQEKEIYLSDNEGMTDNITPLTEMSGYPDTNVRAYKCINNTEKESKKKKTDEEARTELHAWAARISPDDPELVGRLMDFCDMRRDRPRPKPVLPGRSVTLITNALERYSDGNVRLMLAMLDNAISGQWDKIYPLRPQEREACLRAAVDDASDYIDLGEDGGPKWI